MTNADVVRVVFREFPSEARDDVLAILGEYGTEDWQREVDRVRLAVLKLASGNLDRLRTAIEAARTEYRDVLASAEYPAYSRLTRTGDLSPDERQRIIDADWKQYNQWLAR